MNPSAREPEELYNQLPCGYHSLDKNGNFVCINDVELQMLGYSREEVIGRHVSDFLTPESFPIFQHNFPLFKQRGWVNNLEFQMLRKDGTILYVVLSATAIRDEAGNFLMSNTVIIDIGDRQKLQAESQAARAALAENEQLLRLSLIGAKAGSWNWNLATGKVSWSPETYELQGYDPSDEVPRYEDWYDNCLHPDDRTWVDNYVRKVLDGRLREFQLEFRIVHPQKGIRWLLSLGQLTINEQGKPIRLSGINLDISDRKQAELIVQQKIAREHLLAEITQAIHQTFDVDRVLQSAVEGVRQLVQTDRVIIFRFHPDWSGKVVSESIASEFISILKTEINDPCFGEKYVEPYRQGRVSWVSDFHLSEVELCYKELVAQFQIRANLVVPILQEKHLWGLLIAHHCRAPREWLPEEIELLQQLATQLGIAIQQAELYQKNAQQAALIDIASDAIFVRDLSNRILFWSKGAENLYGWKEEELKNRVAGELFPQKSLAQLAKALKITIDRGSWNGELKQVTKDGRELIVESRWTLMRDRQDNPQSILVVNTDISEKKQLEKQLLHAQRLESIGTLAGGIAHDLNNILTPILAVTQLLPIKNPNLEPSSLELLRLIKKNALRGADIVKQVLLFSREIESEWETIDLSQVIEETIELITETFPKSIAIEYDISPNLWQIYGDFTQLHQVLMNLCVNARDAMPDGGKLVISAQNLSLDRQYLCTDSQIEVGNYILITVSDTGNGIPPEIIDRIFDPFFTTKEPGQGTGLGLSTVIGIVKNHSGTIEVQSDLGAGTEFKIYLPVSESRATTETITDDETIYSGQRELILIVDDETPIREVTKATLKSHNYRVITASDGLEAIAIYAQQPREIEVVLIDLVMPEMDGLTAMRALKKINPQVKLIVTSGMATKEKVSAAELIGIKSFLVKPYTAEKLLSYLKRAIAVE